MAENFEQRRELSPEADLLPTRASLLLRLQAMESESWREFFEVYWKLIYGTARRCGLNDAEAQDVVQETMIGVSRNIPSYRYEPETCSFKTWLMNLTRWRIQDQFRARKSHEAIETMQHLAEPDSFSQVWEADWERNLLSAAMERVKGRINPANFQVFASCALQGKTPRETAQLFNLSAPRVYLIRHRVAKEIRREVRKLQSDQRPIPAAVSGIQK